jgi:hypothetical protein
VVLRKGVVIEKVLGDDGVVGEDDAEAEVIAGVERIAQFEAEDVGKLAVYVIGVRRLREEAERRLLVVAEVARKAYAGPDLERLAGPGLGQ